MALEDIVSVSISASSKSPTRPGFGTSLLLVNTVPAGWGPKLSRVFGTTTELLDAGFTVDDLAYKMAAKLKSARTAPKTFRIGKRSSLTTEIVTLTINAGAAYIAEDYVYDFEVDGTEIEYTVLAGATASTIATAIAALIHALPNVTAAAVGAVITVTGAAAGTIFDVEGWADHGIELHNTTTDPGVAADLAAIWAENSDWYAIALDFAGEAEILAAAAFAETNKRIFCARTSDAADCDDGDATNLPNQLMAGSFFRTYCQYGEHSLLNFEDVGLLGSRLPATPGSDTWAFKELPGVFVSDLDAGKQTALKAMNVGYYVTEAGLNVTQGGKGSGGEWMDVIRFIDWLESEIKIRVFAMFANSPKVPYTNAGRDRILSIVEGALGDGVSAGGLDKDPAPSATAPDVQDIDSTIRATRVYPEIEFSGRLAGAIHAVEIAGTLSV